LTLLAGKSKAQISSQVFVYVLASVMIALLLFIGVKAIATIIGVGGKVPLDTLKSDFRSDVESVARQYGSVKKVELNVPEKYDEICFVDSMEDDGKFDSSVVENSLIKDSVESGAPENVFLVKKGIWDYKFEADNLDVQSDYLCLKNVGKLEIWLKGAGKKALLYTQNE
jgi:hypothetical protein